MGRLFGNIKLPGFLQGQADKLGTSQVLGSRWKWLADIRVPLEGNDFMALTMVLVDSPLTKDQLQMLASSANAAKGER